MKIRPMESQDKPLVLRMLENTPEFLPMEVEVAVEVIDDYLENSTESGYTILVAEVEGDASGYICYGLTPLTEGTWDIYWIAADPNKKRQGIGRELMSTAENNIWQAGGRLILVETASKPEYDKTNLFYQRIGYKQVCRVPDFYAIGDDKIIYEKRINPK